MRNEQEHIAAILRAHRDHPHATLLVRYRDHFATRDRKPITQWTVLTAAVALIAERDNPTTRVFCNLE